MNQSSEIRKISGVSQRQQMRIAVHVRRRLDEQPALGQVADDLVGGLGRRDAVQPAVVVVEAPGLVDRRQHRQVVHARELEVLGAAPGRDVDDAGALVERDLVPRDHAVLDGRAAARGRRTAPGSAARRAPRRGPAHVRLVRVARDRDPLAVLAQAVLGVGLDRGRDVRRQRPRRRRPDDERLALPVEQRQADEERRVGALLVDAGLRELVLRDRRPAARAPLGRAVAQVEPPALVHELQEAPDVLDVRVGEREVVVAPVHPLAEPLRAARELRSPTRRPSRGTGARTRPARTPRSRASSSGRARARRRPRSRGPGSRSRSGSAGRSRAAPCSAGRRPSACGPTPCGRRASCSPSPGRRRSSSSGRRDSARAARSNVPSRSQSSRISRSSAGWSGTAGSGLKYGSAMRRL